VSKEIISTDGAPAAIGPYSQAVRCGRLLFVSGQIPLDPATGSMVAGGIVEQTDRVLRNLAAVIEAGGGTLAHVVKISCFLADMNDFSAFNEVFGRFFAESPPARETVEVARLPKDALVEVSAICRVDGQCTA